jgi:hypothetical protein
MRSDEKRIARQVVADLLQAGFALSVYDGEEYTVRRSRDAAVIQAALGTTDEDRIDAYDGGTVWLIYGNEPGVLIADYSLALERHLTKSLALSDSIAE